MLYTQRGGVLPVLHHVRRRAVRYPLTKPNAFYHSLS